MSNKILAELPEHSQDGIIQEVAVLDPQGVAYRVDLAKAVHKTQAEAIQRIREIFVSGQWPLIIPYRHE